MEHTVENWDFGRSPWSLGHDHLMLSVESPSMHLHAHAWPAFWIMPFGFQPLCRSSVGYKACSDLALVICLHLYLIPPEHSKPYPITIFMISCPRPLAMGHLLFFMTPHIHTKKQTLQLPNSYPTMILFPSDWFPDWVLFLWEPRPLGHLLPQHLLTCIVIAYFLSPVLDYKLLESKNCILLISIDVSIICTGIQEGTGFGEKERIWDWAIRHDCGPFSGWLDIGTCNSGEMWGVGSHWGRSKSWSFWSGWCHPRKVYRLEESQAEPRTLKTNIHQQIGQQRPTLWYAWLQKMFLFIPCSVNSWNNFIFWENAFHFESVPIKSIKLSWDL